MLNQFQANNQESFLFSVFVRKWPHIARYMVVLVGLLVFTKLGVAQESTEDVAESNPPQIAQEEADPAINKEDSQKGAEDVPAVDEMTPELNRAVELGLAYLKKEQLPDGSFGEGKYRQHVGITSLAALAIMADGNLPGRGPHGEMVQKALDFILSNITETGLIAADKTSHGPMYGHGFATLFLGEIYGMNPTDTRVRDGLVKAVNLIIGTQNSEGGWRYNPVPFDADISVTICQVMALRSARNAGIKVPKKTIDQAIDYVKNCQNPDGGFKYMLNSGSSAWPRTAAGVATLFYAGLYEDAAITKGIEYLNKKVLPNIKTSGQPHYYYGQYYAVQAMYLAGGDQWKRWWPEVREALVRNQSSSGGWLDHHAGGSYATAMSLIILQMPKRYLPIFQR